MKEKIKENKQVILILVLTALLIASTFLAKIFLSKNNRDIEAVVSAKKPVISAKPIEEDYMDEKGNLKDSYYEDYEKWIDERLQLLEVPDGYEKAYLEFFNDTKNKFLDLGSKDNQLYSPINIYMAYGMLAETTEGNSKKQLLDALHQTDLKKLQKDAKSLWKTNYTKLDDNVLEFNNSIWLKDDYYYKEDTLNTIAEEYLASVFSGKFGTDQYNQKLINWINENTNNLFKDSIKDMKMDPNTIMALASTVYLKDNWSEKFEPSLNDKKIFKNDNGEKEYTFMNGQFRNGYVDEENFVGTYLNLSNTNTRMWVMLPKEGKNISDIIESDKLLDAVKLDNSSINTAHVNLSIPKFDISSKLDLIEKTKELGVTDIFDPKIADFSKLTGSSNGIAVSSITHEARTKIDEEGLEAAAYTLIVTEETALEDSEEFDFILDKPFVIVITGYNDVPLFLGVVNNPLE